MTEPESVDKRLAGYIHQSTCPACGHHVAVSFFSGGQQPLATLGWPKSTEDAKAMTKLPLSFVRCVDCGHVYNREFSYNHVPYSDHPNLMFNRSRHWSRHLDHVRDLILSNLPEKPVVVEIGCGTGHLLSNLAVGCPQGRFIGFDPNAAISDATAAVTARQALFDPAVHLDEIRPNMVISRHVLEHLLNPLAFVQRLSFAAEWCGWRTKLYLEVPCIDPVFSVNRVNDFYYEHNSHFTVESFTRMLERCVSRIHLIETAYGNEVVYGLVTVGEKPHRRSYAKESLAFHSQSIRKKQIIQEQLDQLCSSNQSIAVWGGTGKGAAFINYFEMDAERFPVVVDSDTDKAGTCVPGSGQVIRFRDYLKEHPADVILICTQWRANDIVAEINECDISYQKIIIEHEGRLIDFLNEPNPYKSA